MARARNIKPGLYKNEQLAECSVWARYLFPGLWMLADREGRLEDRPRRIKAELLPFDTEDVGALLDDLAEHGFLVRYQVADGRFIQIANFVQHQNPHHMEVPSVIPPPRGATNKFNHAPISKAQRLRILSRDGNRCTSCGATEKLQLDHIVSRVSGGSSDDSNLRTLCKRCNLKKGSNREPIDIDSMTTKSQRVNGGVNLASSLIPSSLIPSSLIRDKRRRFAPPSTAEVDSYVQEKKYQVNAQQFVDHYTANGWKVGKNPMVDWRAAVRTWARRDEVATKPFDYSTLKD